MSLRIAVLVAVVMAATAAVAEPDALQRLHRWLWPNAPRTEPVVVFPLPELPPVQTSPVPAPEPPVALPRPRPKSIERQPKQKRKTTRVEPQPLSGGGQSAPSESKPSASVCNQIGTGLSVPWGGRAYVIREARKRGYSKSETEQAIAACGY